MINAMAIQSICPKTKGHVAVLSAESAAFLNVCRRRHGCVWTSKIGDIGFHIELGGAAGVLEVISGRSRSASDNLDADMVVNRCADRPRFSNQLAGWCFRSSNLVGFTLILGVPLAVVAAISQI